MDHKSTSFPHLGPGFRRDDERTETWFRSKSIVSFAGITRLGSEHCDSLLVELAKGLCRGSLVGEA